MVPAACGVGATPRFPPPCTSTGFVTKLAAAAAPTNISVVDGDWGLPRPAELGMVTGFPAITDAGAAMLFWLPPTITLVGLASTTVFPGWTCGCLFC